MWCPTRAPRSMLSTLWPSMEKKSASPSTSTALFGSAMSAMSGAVEGQTDVRLHGGDCLADVQQKAAPRFDHEIDRLLPAWPVLNGLAVLGLESRLRVLVVGKWRLGEYIEPEPVNPAVKSHDFHQVVDHVLPVRASGTTSSHPETPDPWAFPAGRGRPSRESAARGCSRTPRNSRRRSSYCASAEAAMVGPTRSRSVL